MNDKNTKQKNMVKQYNFSVKEKVHVLYTGLLKEINSGGSDYKSALKKITMNDLLEDLFASVDDKRKSELKAKRITGSAKLEVYRQRYEKTKGFVSDDEWAEFLMSPEFQRFRKENIDCLAAI